VVEPSFAVATIEPWSSEAPAATPEIVTLPSVASASFSLCVSVMLSAIGVSSLPETEAEAVRVGGSATGLTVTLMNWVAVAVRDPSVAGAKLPWSPSGTLTCRPLRSVAGLSSQVPPPPAEP
jgi:hypothetical protein